MTLANPEPKAENVSKKRKSRRKTVQPSPPPASAPKHKPRLAAPKSMRALFAQRVKAERKSMAMSQEQFAEACDLHRTYIGAIERAERNVSLDTMERMANALKLPLFTLLRKI